MGAALQQHKFQYIFEGQRRPSHFLCSSLLLFFSVLIQLVVVFFVFFSFSSSLSLGLGHLISCILINGAQYFKRISESGIKKMCRNIFVLQQNLTNITMSREADLDFARYESCYISGGVRLLHGVHFVTQSCFYIGPERQTFGLPYKVGREARLHSAITPVDAGKSTLDPYHLKGLISVILPNCASTVELSKTDFKSVRLSSPATHLHRHPQM